MITIKVKIKKKYKTVIKLPEKEARKKYGKLIKKEKNNIFYLNQKAVKKGYSFYKYSKFSTKVIKVSDLCLDCSNHESKKHYYVPFSTKVQKHLAECEVCKSILY